MKENYSNSKALVIGLGESGFSAALLLKDLGARVKVSDSSQSEHVVSLSRELMNRGIDVELGFHSNEFCQDVDFVIVSPGACGNHDLLNQFKEWGIPVYGELDWASRFITGKIIAVTGSNGKSTTATLIAHFLKSSCFSVTLAGNIGRSVSRALREDPSPQYWVLEVSSYQLENIQFLRPWVAILLNISENHLDHYEHYEDYVRAKLNLFVHQSDRDFAVVHHSMRSLYSGKAKLLTISGEPSSRSGVCVQNGQITDCIENVEKVLKTHELPVPGQHFAENFMFAYAAGKLCGLSRSQMTQAIKSFRSLAHRQERVGEWNGILWINDSKATSLEAVRSALETFPAPIVWLAGGRFKGGHFELLRNLVSSKVREAHFFGESREYFSTTFRGACPLISHPSMKDALVGVHGSVTRSDTVILSPGCSSFDEFKNFEERGQIFKELVSHYYGIHALHSVT